MVLIDSVIRLVPGVLGDPESLTEETHNDPGVVEYPQYTRPRVFRGAEVPEVLLGGNHAVKMPAMSAKLFHSNANCHASSFPKVCQFFIL